LGVPPTLTLSKQDLEDAFHHAIRRVHPDVLDKKDPTSPLSAPRLNQAYQRLSDPYSRAVALYERATGETLPMTTTDPDILALAMELKEAPPEERRAARDALWTMLIALEDRQDWPAFLKTLLHYRYCRDKV
jgi:curved DNA-binding protein CbpA